MSARFAPAILVLLSVGGLAVAEPDGRTDALGDPLPDGAVARLGSLRWQPIDRVTQLAFSPDGKRLVSGGDAGLSVWDAASGRELRRVPLAGGQLRTLHWPAAGPPVAVVGLGDGSYYLWDFADERVGSPPNVPRPPFVGRTDDDDNEVMAQFAISADGKRLAVGRHGSHEKARPIDIWDVETGKRLTELKPPRTLVKQVGNCTGLAFTSDGKTLLAFSRDKTSTDERLVVWDIETGTERSRQNVPFAIQQRWIKVCAVSPDGKTAALGLPDSTARLVNLDGKAEPRSVAHHVGDLPYEKGVSAVAFSPDGRTLVTAGRDRMVRAWDSASGKEVRTLEAKSSSWVEAVAFSQDGGRVATAGQGSLIRVWDVRTGADAAPHPGHRGRVWGVAVAPDGKAIVTVGEDDTLRFWDSATSREHVFIPLGARAGGQPAFTPDGKSVVVNVGDGIKVWDTTGKPATLPGGLATSRGASHGFAADGKTLITADRGLVSLWDWPAGRVRRTIELPAQPHKPEEMYCLSAALSPDGRLLVTSSQRHYTTKSGEYIQTNSLFVATEFWDVATGGRLARLGSQDVWNALVAFTPDGRSLVTAGDSLQEGALGFWDPRSAPRRRAIGSPVRPSISTFAVSPDGRSLATVGRERCVQLYEVATGQTRRSFTGHRSAIVGVSFTPDGRRLVTVSDDSTGLIWDISQMAGKPEMPADFDAPWAELAAVPAEPAYRAMARLAAHPACVARVKKHLRPVEGGLEALLDKLVGDLNDDRFAVRERGSAELDRLGESAVDAVRALARSAKSAEVRRRLVRYLEKYDRDEPSPELLRQGRALELLEQIGTPEARAVLRDLAGGAPTARLTREAAAALRRLEGM
jgi:WD40 repeat protein